MTDYFVLYLLKSVCRICSRFSSAGRASDWRSEGPVFDPRRWHSFSKFSLVFQQNHWIRWNMNSKRMKNSQIWKYQYSNILKFEIYAFTMGKFEFHSALLYAVCAATLRIARTSLRTTELSITQTTRAPKRPPTTQNTKLLKFTWKNWIGFVWTRFGASVFDTSWNHTPLRMWNCWFGWIIFYWSSVGM